MRKMNEPGFKIINSDQTHLPLRNAKHSFILSQEDKVKHYSYYRRDTSRSVGMIKTLYFIEFYYCNTLECLRAYALIKIPLKCK